MSDYTSFTTQELIARIHALEALLDAVKVEKDSQELFNFPWAGNLGNWYWHLKSNRVICNDQKILALGYHKEEIPESIGFEFFTEKLHPDDYERVMDNMRAHLSGKSPAYETSYRIQTRKGEWLWFYDRGQISRRGESGAPEMVSGIVFDISEEKRMEELLERQNLRLKELSTTDFLTNLYNRRALFELLEYELGRRKRHQRPLALIMLDIDHFKKINDTYGHLAGDKVLAKSAEIIRKSVRKTDIVGRYGGEEFIIVLPECTLADGAIVAEKIRAAVQESEFEGGIQVTISAGLVENKDETAEQLIDAADQYLYQAKHNGRNRIAFPPQ
jgi:diguanylate cyclase (GGDEF)-like protein/PAS domain S-box-containing protein